MVLQLPKLALYQTELRPDMKLQGLGCATMKAGKQRPSGKPLDGLDSPSEENGFCPAIKPFTRMDGLSEEGETCPGMKPLGSLDNPVEAIHRPGHLSKGKEICLGVKPYVGMDNLLKKKNLPGHGILPYYTGYCREMQRKM